MTDNNETLITAVLYLADQVKDLTEAINANQPQAPTQATSKKEVRIEPTGPLADDGSPTLIDIKKALNKYNKKFGKEKTFELITSFTSDNSNQPGSIPTNRYSEVMELVELEATPDD